MKKYFERWLAFIQTISDPLVIILLILTVILYINSINQPDQTLVSLLTFLVAIFSSLLGGILVKRWDDFTEEKIVVTRAKSASRSLQVLLNNIIALENRVRQFLDRHNDPELSEKISHEVLKTYFEEVVKECVSLEERVINSIEDWKDILPTLEVTAVLNLIRELNVKGDTALAQFEKINNELQETKDKSEVEVNKLMREKEELSNELNSIKRELREKSFQVGIPSLSTSLISGSTGTFNATVLDLNRESRGMFSFDESPISIDGQHSGLSTPRLKVQGKVGSSDKSEKKVEKEEEEE